MTPPLDQESLLVHLRPLMRHSALRLLHPDEHRHVADLAQEGWIQVWRALPKMPDTCTGFDEQISWCMAVARNRMRNVVRYDLAAPTHGDRNATLPGDEVLDTFAYVDQAEAVQDEYHDGRVAAAVAALPPGYRAYVTERFWHGVPTTVLQKTMSPAIWTRVKRRLAEELDDLVAR